MKKNILLVVNDNSTTVLVEKHLRALGCNLLLKVRNGEEAFEKAGELNLDAMMVDITHDDAMVDIAAAKKMYEYFDIPFIFITSDSEDTAQEQAKLSNPYGYLIKPFNKMDVKITLEMALLRHEMEKTLIENESKFLNILNSIGDAVIVTDLDERIIYMNPIAENLVGFKYDEVANKKFRDVAKITNTAIRSMKELKISRDMPETIQDYIETKKGKKIPVDFNISPQKDYRGNTIGVVIVLHDITERVKFEDELNDSFSKIRRAMGGTIQAMAQTVEARDPYTAGHQRRVADIARSIATIMELPKDKIEGLRLAGVIHDLGKISIPSEILTKPIVLTDIEYEIIKNHSQAGYDILKNVEFPWPIADMVYQHHERVDGSGYPNGIKGNEILIESKILAVSDVVEAMASYRPYRAALGIEAALEEVLSNRGQLYDTEVTGACVKLFKEEGYEIKV
ncbi:HD domain-containing phosphohydrolase [Spirochaetota bacterium]